MPHARAHTHMHTRKRTHTQGSHGTDMLNARMHLKPTAMILVRACRAKSHWTAMLGECHVACARGMDTAAAVLGRACCGARWCHQVGQPLGHLGHVRAS